VNVGVLALILAIGDFAVMSSAAEKAKKKAGDDAACNCNGRQREEGERSTTICPMYCVMQFGSYWTYYALHAPGCTDPRTWDGPPNLTPPPRDCVGGTNCFSVKRKNGQRKRPHGCHDEIARDGRDVNPNNVTMKPQGVSKKRVFYIEFHKNRPGQGKSSEKAKKLIAKVYWVRITPAEFEPPRQNEKPIERGFGFQVDKIPDGNALPVYSVDDSQVATIERDRRTIAVVVHDNGTIWREYNVVLKTTEKP